MHTFRVLHQRSDGVRPTLLFLNRTVQAETAEEALRLAMHGKAAQMQIDVRGIHLALARPLVPSPIVECWRAEVEMMTA